MARLFSPRLALRRAGEDDFGAILALLSDAEVMRFVGSGRPLSRGEARAARSGGAS